MTQAIQLADPSAIMERVLIAGDLGKLSAGDRVQYYRAVCESVGLNPLTKPFEYINLNGKLTLYATKNCTDQLRSLAGVSVSIVAREKSDDMYVVTARATTPQGRTDEDVGAVVLPRGGEALANAMMKAHTKAKRRVTLSICGLSFVDESEIESIPTARPATIDHATGEVLPALPPSRDTDDKADMVVALLDDYADCGDDEAYRSFEDRRKSLWPSLSKDAKASLKAASSAAAQRILDAMDRPADDERKAIQEAS